MRIQYYILFAIVLLLTFVRTYFESYLVQLGLNDQQYADFYRCTIIGCFLKFKYQLLLDVISFGILFLLAKRYLYCDTQKGLIASGIFVVVFMWTDVYVLIGGLIGSVILL